MFWAPAIVSLFPRLTECEIYSRVRVRGTGYCDRSIRDIDLQSLLRYIQQLFWHLSLCIEFHFWDWKNSSFFQNEPHLNRESGIKKWYSFSENAIKRFFINNFENCITDSNDWSMPVYQSGSINRTCDVRLDFQHFILLWIFIWWIKRRSYLFI